MMENSAAESEKLITKPLLDDDHDASAGKGGFKTMPFILANESFDSFEQVASNGPHPNMILYLTREYHLKMASWQLDPTYSLVSGNKFHAPSWCSSCGFICGSISDDLIWMCF